MNAIVRHSTRRHPSNLGRCSACLIRTYLMKTRSFRPKYSAHKAICIAIGILAAFLVPGRAETPALALDPEKSQGTWDGWGTSLCWWAKAFGDRDDIADLLFTAKVVDFQGEKVPGL